MKRSARRVGHRPQVDIPKFTYGLEGKLLSLIGEPILLAQRIVRPKFETETSVNESLGIRYTYSTQKHISYREHKTGMFPWDIAANSAMFNFTPAIITRVFNFRLDLFENSDGRLQSFSFALQVSS